MNKQQQKEFDFQKHCSNYWSHQHALCQTSLIEHLMGEEVSGFSYEEVINYFHPSGDDEDPQEVLEWWLIPYNLGTILDNVYDQPILKNDFGTWWGRTTSGQAVHMDSTIRGIVKEMKIYE